MKVGYRTRRPLFLCAAWGLFWGACSGSSSNGLDGGTDGGNQLPARAINITCKIAQTEPYKIERYTNLSFAGGDQSRGPAGLLIAPDNPDRMFVVEQRGIIHTFLRSAPDTSAVFLDLTSKVITAGDEQGLLGLVFDPNYGTTGAFYVNYTRAGDGNTIISRFARQSSGQANAASEEIILTVEQPFDRHKGGQMAFGPDGKLYIGLGDGGSHDDPGHRGQDKSTLLGKILRIEVTPGQAGYRVPADNPFVNEMGSRGEIWAYGLRNPWRFSFDGEGTLWAGDVGQERTEEIDIITKGGNYGWSIMEGPFCHANDDGTIPNCTHVGTLPVATYSHNEGCAVIGGFVYRGAALPELVGAYLYGDYCTGQVWAIHKNSGSVTAPVPLFKTGFLLTSFGEDVGGELYVVERYGGIYRIARNTDSPLTVPTQVSQTGCYSDTARRAPATGLVAYEVNAPLWSDGTVKQRYLALPGKAVINYASDGAWGFPEGTLLMKEFYLETEQGNASSRRILETRLLLRHGAGWQGFTYQWNDTQTDATLLDAGKTAAYSRTNPPGSYTHTFPSREDCLRCHTSAAGGTLGMQTLEMNRNHDYGGRVANQLAEMQRLGLFGTPGFTAPPASAARLPDPFDNALPLADRARAYLHGNCAQCHRPGGPTPTALDLRYATPLAMTGTCNASPGEGDLGVAGAKVITPGQPDHSVMWLRMFRRGAGQMPPLATSVVDDTGAKLIGDWITQLTGCN